MTKGEGPQRPGAVTFSVVLMYIGGIAQILLGILTIFLRYTPEAQSGGIALPITLLGAGMILFGLLVIGLASGVARGSNAARRGATAVMVLGLAITPLLVVALCMFLTPVFYVVIRRITGKFVLSEAERNPDSKPPAPQPEP